MAPACNYITDVINWKCQMAGISLISSFKWIYKFQSKMKLSSGGLVVKHPVLHANGHRFEPRKRSKLFQGLISRLTTPWVADHVKWRCRLH